MKALFRVTAPGPLTTIQDLGRPGHARLGVPGGGAADPEAARMVNLALGNDENAPVLEVTFAHPALVAQESTVVAVSPGPALLHNGEVLPPFVPRLVRSGDLLAPAPVPGLNGWRSMRSYLAVLGGFNVPLVLGGRGTFLPAAMGGPAGRPLQAGDLLLGVTPGEAALRLAVARPGLTVPPDFSPPAGQPWLIRFVWGPHAALFDPQDRLLFTRSLFVAGPETDRTGIRLSGPPIVPRVKGVASCGVPTGTLQVPADGQPILLLPDHQTTGGYPIIGVVVADDLPRLGRIAPQDTIMFLPVPLGQARAHVPRFWHVRVAGENFSVGVWEESRSAGAKGRKTAVGRDVLSPYGRERS